MTTRGRMMMAEVTTTGRAACQVHKDRLHGCFAFVLCAVVFLVIVVQYPRARWGSVFTSCMRVRIVIYPRVLCCYIIYV